MKKSLTINYIYNVIYKILTLITPLITTPYVSRVLGVDNIGIYNYTYAILNYFVLFGVLGLQMYGQREISYKCDNKTEKDKTFWEIFWTRILTTAFVTIIYIIFSFNSSYRDIYLIFIFELIANAIDISWFYYGTEDFKSITIKNIIVKLIGIISIFIFVKTQNDLKIYILCHTLVLFLGNCSLWLGIKHKISKIYGISKICLQHFKFAIIFFIPQCLDSVYMLMDKVMLGNLSNITQVGIYGQADKIVKMLVTVITSLGLVVSPRIAQCYSKSDKEGIQYYMKKSFSFIFIIGIPMMLGLIAISDGFSNWFFGEEYIGVGYIIKIMSPIIILMGLNSVMGWQYMMTVHREKEFTISVGIGAIINFALNLILIPKLEAKGATIASVISMFIMSVVNYKFTKDTIKLKEIIKDMVKPLVSGIAMYIVILLISYHMEISIFNTAIQIFIGVIIYAILLIIMKEENILVYWNKIRNR